MTFINPIELLELERSDVSLIDSSTIKKAKRKLQAEIDLSDEGYLLYHGHHITKADAERVINELDDAEKMEFYHFIAANKVLNQFLSTGATHNLNQLRQESIYKLESFVQFVSPYFSDRYNRALFDAYKNRDSGTMKTLVSMPLLASAADKDKIYRSLLTAIKDNIREVEEETSDIKNGESYYDESTCDGLVFWIEDEVLDVKIINLLPSYFQSVRNQCAQAVRNLSVNVFNELGDSEVAIDLLEYALEFKIDGLTKQNLQGDLEQIQKIHNQRKEEESQAPVLQKYGSAFVEAQEKIKAIEAKSITPAAVQAWANVTFDAAEINGLDAVFNELRDQTAMALRVLSVAVWNNYSNIDVAHQLIDKASQITISDTEIKQNIQEAKAQLDKIKNEMTLEQVLAIIGTGTPKSPAPPRPAPTPTPVVSVTVGAVVMVSVVMVVV